MASGSLQILNARHSDSGSYRCVAHNPYLQEKMSANHVVNVKVVKPKHAGHTLRSLRFVSNSADNVNAIIGSNITLECVANGFPPPKLSWTRLDGDLPRGRSFLEEGNLIITTVQRGDEGTYSCSASNGKSTLTANSILQVYEMPQILSNSYESIELVEGQPYDLVCNAEGQPKPIISWLHNGYFLDSQSIQPDLTFEQDGSVLRITQASLHSHTGVFQCFATNELGSTYAIKVVSVRSQKELLAASEERRPNSDHKPVDQGEDNNLGNEEEPTQHHHHHHQHHGKKKHRNKESNLKMIPPSKPEVSMLNDDSVMVRWTVAKNSGGDGLPIMFFKVQYKEVNRGEWNTVDEDIPAHINTYSVVGLNPNATYRFRIAAVYSNDDNKNGKSSNKFHFTLDPLVRKPTNPPIILNAASINTSTVQIQWEFLNIETIPIEGFFIYYRAADSAGEYLKLTALGIETRAHNITHLLANTPYEIKMRCFNSAGTSDFSNIYMFKTLAEDGPGKTNNKVDYDNLDSDLARNSPGEGNSNLISNSLNLDNNRMQLIAIVTVAIAIVLVIVACLVICIIRQKNQTPSSKVGGKPLKPPATPSDYYFASAYRSNGQLNGHSAGQPVNNSASYGKLATTEAESVRHIADMPILQRKNSLRSSLSYSSHHLYNSTGGKYEPSVGQESIATIDRKRSIKNSLDPYFDYPRLSHHSTSFTRLNGTLERKRRSRTDLNSLEKAFPRSHISSTNDIQPNNATYFPPNGQIMIMQSSC